MKYKCLIIDDEQLARELIEMYCKKTPQLELVGLCKNTQEAIEIMNSTGPMMSMRTNLVLTIVNISLISLPLLSTCYDSLHSKFWDN